MYRYSNVEFNGWLLTLLSSFSLDHRVFALTLLLVLGGDNVEEDDAALDARTALDLGVTAGGGVVVQVLLGGEALAALGAAVQVVVVDKLKYKFKSSYSILLK